MFSAVQTGMRRPPHVRDPHAHVIRPPGKRLLQQIPLGFVWSKVNGRRGRSPNASLNLASFIDFLLVTTIFLLMSFSASGESNPRMKLARAANVEAIVDAPIVSVAHGQILVDGVAAGTTLAIEETGRREKLDALSLLLRQKRELWLQIQPNKPFPGVVVLAIDEATSALVVKSVFQSAAYAGYPNVSFLVKTIPTLGADLAR